MLLLIFLVRCFTVFGFSVLTHEAIIDANWDRVIVPMIKQRFPSASEQDLQTAHAFAYGGSVVPDMGYYPFGSKLFTNLIHYARSGDFIETLLADAITINDFAFALGVLCHYHADNYGHSIAVNLSVPLIYPKMREKFGNRVTYADDRISHMRTEFAFDVLQTGRGNYVSQNYHAFIGFQVADELLQKAFLKTYGLEVKHLFKNFNRSMRTFRWCVRNLIPFVTRIAWKKKQKEIKELNPSATRHNYIYRIRRSDYYRQYGNDRDKSSFGGGLVSFIIKIVPKIGPLRVLKFRIPTADAEKLFLVSFDTTILKYAADVRRSTTTVIDLPNQDCDTGKSADCGEYALADKTYSEWLLKLQENKFQSVSPEMKSNILAFYSVNNMNNPTMYRCHEAPAALDQLRKSQ